MSANSKRIFSIMLMIASVIGLGACGGGSDDDYAYLLGGSPTELSACSAAVRDCAPYLGTADAAPLELWNDWNPDQADGLINLLFNPDAENRMCIYTAVETLDYFIGQLNRYSEYFGLSEGIYTGGGYTVTISTVSSATIPFFTVNNTTTEVNRRLQIVAAAGYPHIDASFLLETGRQVVVLKAQYQYGLSNSITETVGGYVALNTATGAVSVRLADFVDDPAGDFAMAAEFSGNTVSQTFDLTLKTNGGTSGRAVMAGGSVASADALIALRATDVADSGAYGAAGANDHANLDADEGYYVIMTRAQIYDPATVDSGVWPKAVGVGNANLVMEPATAAKYIRTSNASCPGWTMTYPADAAAIASF